MAPTAGDVLFVDTNVLLTATDALRPSHREAQRLLAESGVRGVHLATSGQVLREYLVVATRPSEANGLGLSVEHAVQNRDEFRRRLHFCDENEDVSLRLRQAAVAHGLRGRRLHDANIAATMLAHRIRFLVTEDGSAFDTFDGIELLTIATAASLMRA